MDLAVRVLHVCSSLTPFRQLDHHHPAPDQYQTCSPYSPAFADNNNYPIINEARHQRRLCDQRHIRISSDLDVSDITHHITNKNDYLRTWNIHRPGPKRCDEMHRCNCVPTEHIYESPMFLRRQPDQELRDSVNLSGVPQGPYYYEEVDNNDDDGHTVAPPVNNNTII